jgi:DNA-binding transcriptional MerR regulator
MVDLSVDLATTLWTVEQAAEAAQVSKVVIRNWKYRGVLEPAKTDWRGRPLFLAVDVIRAEKATRERARRVYPTAA